LIDKELKKVDISLFNLRILLIIR